MTEEIATRKVSATFERKLDLGNYNNVVGRAWVEQNVPADAMAGEVSEALSGCFELAKAVVLDELGIEVIIDDNGVIREKYNPAVTKMDSGERNLRRETGATGGFDTKGVKVANEKDMTENVPDWVAEIVEQTGMAGVWANKGQYGTFYKEYVPKDAEPVLGYDERNGKQVTKILKKPS